MGVSAAAQVAVVAGGAAAGAAAEDEKTTVNVVLTSAGGQKIAVIKVIRDLTGLDIANKKDSLITEETLKETLTESKLKK